MPGTILSINYEAEKKNWNKKADQPNPSFVMQYICIIEYEKIYKSVHFDYYVSFVEVPDREHQKEQRKNKYYYRHW